MMNWLLYKLWESWIGWRLKFSTMNKMARRMYVCMGLHSFLMTAVLLVCGAIPKFAADPPLFLIYSIYLVSLAVCYASMRSCAARNMDCFRQLTGGDEEPKWKKKKEESEKDWPPTWLSCLVLSAVGLWLPYHMINVWTGDAEMMVGYVARHIDDMWIGVFYLKYIVFNCASIVAVLFWIILALKNKNTEEI